MTSSVKIAAHCSEDVEVVVIIYSTESDTLEYILNNGETKDLIVFDTRTVEVFERKKACS